MKTTLTPQRETLYLGLLDLPHKTTPTPPRETLYLVIQEHQQNTHSSETLYLVETKNEHN